MPCPCRAVLIHTYHAVPLPCRVAPIHTYHAVLCRANSYVPCRVPAVPCRPNSHIPCRAPSVPCRVALIHTCRVVPLPSSNSAVIFRESPLVAGKIRTANRETSGGSWKKLNLSRSHDLLIPCPCRAVPWP